MQPTVVLVELNLGLRMLQTHFLGASIAESVWITIILRDMVRFFVTSMCEDLIRIIKHCQKKYC